MENTQTTFQTLLFFISCITMIIPLVYVIVIKIGMSYNNPMLYFFIFALIAVTIFIGINYAIKKAPFLLMGLNILLACILYYCFIIWEPYPAFTELKYDENTELNGLVKSYNENLYLLSGTVDEPKKGRILDKTISVFFDKEGNKIKDSLIYREGFLEKPRTIANHYKYNQLNQLINKNDQFTYTYNEQGQLIHILELKSYVSRNRPIDNKEETIYTRDEIDNSLLIEIKRSTTRHYANSKDTSFYNQTNQHFFNDKGQVLYKGIVKEGEFTYDEKYEYNTKNQLISKLKVGFDQTKTTYVYDSKGYLKTETSINYDVDSTKISLSREAKYDTLGYKTYTKRIDYYYEKDHHYFPKHQKELFYENEYDDLQNLIRQVIFIKETGKPKRPYYVVEIDLTYYDK